MRILRSGLLAASAALLLILTGCANTSAKRTEAGLELDLSAKGDEGFVVLKVVSTRPISLLNPKWQSVQISSNGKRDEINDITQGYNMLMGRHVPTESLYFAKLSAGDYEVTGLGSIGPGPGLLLALAMGDQANVNKKLPGFKVEAGRLANLGTIVFSPAFEKEQAEQMFLLRGPPGKKAALDTLLAEANHPPFPLTEGGGWGQAASAEDDAAALAQARQHVSMLNIRKIDGALMAGSHLGQVFARSGPQTWSRESIDTLDTVFSVARAADGRLIAGSAHGQYFLKNPGGEWRRYRLGKEAGRIAYIEPRADGSAIFIVGDLRQSKLWLKKSLDDPNEVPTLIGAVTAPPDNVLATDKAIFMAWNIPGISRETDITRIDKASLQVTAQREKFWVVEWRQLADGTIKLSRQNGMSVYNSFSTDEMKTWTHGDVSGLISTYWLDANRAMALDWKTGFVMVTNLLHATSDAGKTWQPIGSPLETRHFAGRLAYADEDEILLQGSNVLYSSVDKGKTWQRQFIPASPKN
jgi:hypothetical protein